MCKKFTSHKANSIGRLKLKELEKITPLQILTKKVGVAILIPDEVGMRTKEITRILYIEKSIHLPRRHENSKCICTKQQGHNIYETETDRTIKEKRTNLQKGLRTSATLSQQLRTR